MPTSLGAAVPWPQLCCAEVGPPFVSSLPPGSLSSLSYFSVPK